eukprot:3478399-Prymnesium_polylepis.4
MVTQYYQLRLEPRCFASVQPIDLCSDRVQMQWPHVLLRGALRECGSGAGGNRVRKLRAAGDPFARNALLAQAAE